MARKKGSGIYGSNINVMLTLPMHNQVEMEARRLDASVSTVVRLALLSYFENKKGNGQNHES